MMRIKVALLTLVVTAGFALGCDHAAESPVAPDGFMSAPQHNLVSGRWSLARAHSQVNYAYTAVVIGRDGGVLRAGEHTLEIRRGAVLMPTWFGMIVREGDNFIVDLYAFSVPSGTRVVAFPANTVFLTLSYSNAVTATASRFGVAYLPNRETIVPLPTATNTGTMQVRTMLAHFSEYAIIFE